MNTHYTFYDAAKNGNLEVVQNIIKIQNDIDMSSINNAFKLSCSNGNLNVAKWLYENYSDINMHLDMHALMVI